MPKRPTEAIVLCRLKKRIRRQIGFVQTSDEKGKSVSNINFKGDLFVSAVMFRRSSYAGFTYKCDT